jgi:hypothetical protein
MTKLHIQTSIATAITTALIIGCMLDEKVAVVTVTLLLLTALIGCLYGFFYNILEAFQRND